MKNPVTDQSQLPKCFGKPEAQPECIENCLLWASCVRFFAQREKLMKEQED